MPQFQGFTAVVTPGISTVYAVWVLNHGGVTGTFISNAIVNWTVPAAGQGRFISSSGTQIKIYRLSGSEPAASTGLIGVGGGSCTVTSVLGPSLPNFAGNPPRFSDSPEQGTIVTNDIFFIDGEPSGEVGSAINITRDKFDLVDPWAGNLLYDAVAVVCRDRTPILGLRRLPPGSKLQGKHMDDNMLILDSITGGTVELPGNWVGLSLNANWLGVVGEATPQFYKVASRVYFSGVLNTPTNPLIVTGSQITNTAIASGWRPQQNMSYNVSGEVIKIATTGVMTFESPDAETGVAWLNLNDISYRAA